MNWLYVIVPLLGLIGLAVGYAFLPAPIKFGLSLLVRGLPSIIKAVKPRDFTPEEKARIRGGGHPFSKRQDR